MAVETYEVDGKKPKKGRIQHRVCICKYDDGMIADIVNDEDSVYFQQFGSREEMDNLINDLIEARDKVFPKE